MAQIYLLVAGVILSSIPARPLGWNLPWIHSLQNRELFILLRQMKKIPFQSCLEDRTDFKFPWKTGNITEILTTQGTGYHHLTLHQAAWNNTLLHKLLSSLDHTLELLHEQVENDNLDCPYLGIVVPKYFQRIHLYLKEKEYTPVPGSLFHSVVKEKVWGLHGMFSRAKTV
uniref:Uncharacterized protein n=1 Tax=Monodon monoceros TaxID=40151 RepID=A0A8C6ALA8_MONMO